MTASPDPRTDAAAFQRHVQDLIDNKTKPQGALGIVEQMALRLAQAMKTDAPRLDRCDLTIFAADHGIVAEGISAYPQEVTREMVLNFLRGGAAANVFAGTVGARVQVVDAGVAGEPVGHADLIDRRIAGGTQNSRTGPAMTEAQRDTALEAGENLAADSSADALCFGEMGIGNTSAASLLAHKILGLSLDDLTGRGTGLDDAGLQHKTAVLHDAAARTAPKLPAADALAEYGGFEIAMMAGAMIGTARSDRPVLVDGFISTAAAVVALGMAPDIRPSLFFSHRSAERGHGQILDALEVRPILDLDMRLGEGTGALLAWPILRAAAAMLTDMASFADAGVSGPV